MTLDHVTPRRGQTAYDRRDNLVLCCPACNAQKADQPFLAFLLARRARAASLLRYGEHLSPMLLQVILHGCYHRGQVALLVRDAGAEPSPTDYIAFVRGSPAAVTVPPRH